jgi:competence protein ComEC
MGRKNWCLIALLLVLLFSLRWKTLPGLPDFKPGQEIRVSGFLRQEPKIIGSSQRFSLAGIEIKTQRFPEYHYGDYLLVVGTLTKSLTNKWELDYPEISKTQPVQKRGIEQEILASISGLRRRIERIYRFSLPEPQASLMTGIVLGTKSGFPYDFYQALKRTGTLHVVVASGMNITIFAGVLVPFLAFFLHRRLALIIGFLGVWFYVILAGLEAPVVRAGIMGSLAFLGVGLGREKEAIRGLVLAGMLMVFINPLYVFDLGFQLSFAATAGILLVYPKIKTLRLTRSLFKLPLFGDELAVTLAAQSLTVPIMVFSLGWFNPLSPLVNALVLWTIPYVMGIGALGGVLGLVNQELGRIFCLPAWPLLTYFVEAVKLFS